MKRDKVRGGGIRCLMRLVAIVLLTAALWGCASIGNPSGGARDEDPPRFLRANPPQGSTEVSRTLRRAVLEFNEIVNVKDAFSKVMISPVSASVPRVSSSGRRVTIEFQDTLAPNTTYTVDFADAIEDNNEGNKLSNFYYTFSTGAVLDTLEISGMVLGARDLEPQQNILVGVYSNLSDTAFSTLPFERVAQTDDRGRFTIGGLADGEYHVYALKDLDNDKKYANPEEDLAFLPYTVRPTAERITVTDTILNLKTGAVDTITERERTLFLPNDLLLRSFNTQRRPQYLAEYARRDSTRLYLRFNAPSDSLPTFISHLFPDIADRLISERSATNDTLTYWLPEDMVRIDTLSLETRFLRPDSTGTLVMGSDILDFVTNRPRATKPRKGKKDEEEKERKQETPSLNIEFLSGSQQEVWKPLLFDFATPTARLDTASFRLEEKKDTLWIPSRHEMTLSRPDSLLPRRFRIDYPWDYSTTYRLLADSASAEGIYGHVMKSISREFSTKSEEDYATLMFDIRGLEPGERGVVELLNGSDLPVRKGIVENGKCEFRFLDPGVYYARLYLDYNGNGEYDTGDPSSGLMPEEAYYYPGRLNIKKNWDIDQTWSIFETPVDLQKASAIRKNKPKDRGAAGPADAVEEEEDIFDPTANPFDPVESRKKKEAARKRAQGLT
ncbi:MAG: Ig-like domain-containing protein [Bacteroides sp.]|nr:Ig-like domain-containing protein [Bacteroides sp.]